MIKNNDCPLHQVLVGFDSSGINASCYWVSNASLYDYGLFNVTDGPSFFDRLDGTYELSTKYSNQSRDYFNILED